MNHFNHQQFSKDLKVQKLNYLDKTPISNALIQQYLQQLEAINIDAIQDDAAKKAFWINIYNGLTNYWIIKKKIKKNMLEKPLLFAFAKINIGGHQWSLDNIEHGILRCNRRSPIGICKPFSARDKRRQWMCETLDYRIHFALNCGGLSCPPIAFYTEENIDKELTLAEESFVEQEFEVDKAQKTLRCSKIFTMYRNDFEGVYINDKRYRDFKIKAKKYSFAIQ